MLERARDGFAATMHDDRVDPDGFEKDKCRARRRWRTSGSGESMKLPPYFTTKI